MSVVIRFIEENGVPYRITEDEDTGLFIQEGIYEPQPSEPVDPKQQKINELNSVCNQKILAGFTSDALGSSNSYEFGTDDQINLGGMLNAITAGLVSEPVIWKASGLPQPHTFAQFKEVFSTGLTHKNTNIGKFWTLKAQVAIASTNEEVESIVW